MTPGEQTIQVRDTPLRLRRAGSGAPLLLLHDATTAGAWSPFMDRLAERFDTILPVHPGWGGGELPAWLETVPDLANFYLDLLDALDLRGVHLVGLSLGGWTAAELAIRNGSRLASLALVAATGLREPGVRGVDDFITNDRETIADLFHDPAVAEAMAARLLAPDYEDALLRNRIAAAQLTWQPRHHDPHLARWLHRIDVPTLIVWGERDRLMPAALAAAWQRGIAGSRLAMIAECGHLPHVERPEALAAALCGFIAERRHAA